MGERVLANDLLFLPAIRPAWVVLLGPPITDSYWAIRGVFAVTLSPHPLITGPRPW